MYIVRNYWCLLDLFWNVYFLLIPHCFTLLLCYSSHGFPTNLVFERKKKILPIYYWQIRKGYTKHHVWQRLTYQAMHAAQTTDEQALSLKTLFCNKVLTGKLEAGCLCIKPPPSRYRCKWSRWDRSVPPPASMWGESAESRILTQHERKKEGRNRHQGWYAVADGSQIW